MGNPGRPPFKPTATQRRKVAAAAACNTPQESIALAIGITPPTLRKHFARELTIGAHAKRIDAIDALYRKANKGNVAACKAVLAMQVAPAPNGVRAEGAKQETPAATKQIRLGKKEQAAHDAGAAAQGSPWESILPSLSTGSTLPQ